MHHPVADLPHYVVAFNQPNGLPANVDKIVADAGGTIVERLPEVGGLGVTSTDPGFLAEIKAVASVKAADTATPTSLDPTLFRGDPAGPSSSNGGTASPTGPDTQPMPDPLGSEQWDKKKLNATLTGSYALQQGRRAWPVSARQPLPPHRRVVVPSNQNKPHMSPTQVESLLQITANNQPCPQPNTVTQGPGFTFATATCQGASGKGAGAGYDNFFGKGIVDALKAITAKTTP